MRISPRLWFGFVIWAAYVIVIVAVSLLSGVPFPDIGTTAEFTWRGAVMDLAAGAALLIVITSVLGWWRPALFDSQRSHHKWPIFVPIIMFVAAIANLLVTDWSQFDASFILSLLALGVLVGFCEELMARGLLLTAFRSQLSEGWVWFLTSALFGLMHLANALLGAPLLASLAQAAVAFASGTAFYIVRRVTGSLIWAMLLHGLWDVSVFAVGHAAVAAPVGAILTPVIAVLSLAVVYWVIKGTDEKAPVRAATANRMTP
ncbi:CPBP family intramembrane glutamic endopeptidase [Microbacterium foliorum]|uniref:CPBP family intramembrane glutamic endopeptidase n=1 Tax=Microbacterium foliorum TaxID=104336 RepID=UPI003734D942